MKFRDVPKPEPCSLSVGACLTRILAQHFLSSKHHQPAQASLIDQSEHYDRGNGEVNDARRAMTFLRAPAPGGEQNEDDC